VVVVDSTLYVVSCIQNPSFEKVLRPPFGDPQYSIVSGSLVMLTCDAGTEHSIAGLEELVRATIWKYFQNENGTIDLDDLGHQEPPEGAGRDESLLRGALHLGHDRRR